MGPHHVTNDATESFHQRCSWCHEEEQEKEKLKKISTFTTYFSFVLYTVEPFSSAWEPTETVPCCLNNNHRIGEMPQQ